MDTLDKVVTATSSQTVLDLALQLYGSVDAVFDLLDANPGIENVMSNPAGQDVSYTITNSANQKYFLSNGISSATKPMRYYNKELPSLLVDSRTYLVREDGYKILI